MSGGSLAITSSTLSSNYAEQGGTIFLAGGYLAVTGSTFSGSTAGGVGYGGAVYTDSGSMAVTSSTFSGNVAAFGGGIYNGGGMVTIMNSTVSGNTAKATIIEDPQRPYNYNIFYGWGGGIMNGGGKVIHNGVLAEFGFNLKYLKNGNIQGQMMFVEHRATGDVVIKSNALDLLSIVKGTTGSGSTAVIVGRATVNGVGNYRFRTTVVDKCEPSSNDKFGLQVTNPAGEAVADLTFSPITLSGGNIQVP